MKRRMAVLILSAMLFAAAPLSGCSGRGVEKAQEYKDLGIKQMENGEYADALESFQSALDQSPGTIGAREIDLCYYKALAQYRAGDVAGAIETYTALADYDEDNWEVYYLRGSAYLRDGQGKLCLEDYNRAVSLNEKDYQLYVHIYENLEKAGYAEKGQTYLDQVMKLKPSSGEDYEGLGYICFLQEDYEKAETNLKKAVDKGDDDALLILGRVYAAMDEIEEARACFEQYRKDYPDDARVVNELGEISLNLGDYEEAAAYFEQAAEMDEDNAQTSRRNLIATREKSGDFSLAYEEAEKYLDDYPNDEVMQREFEFLKTRVAE